ncbi:hypothetical protein PR048_015167 [Dryococelus australis]|uniref:Transposase n=1 Tax=Dryococelus australis TaxID=614101 RepID=A0ABQ9HGC1_9NEOP|nr:hypothetical protein PR048_015167 [Dryococelus australis]
MVVIKVTMEQRRNERVGETGDPRENPPTNGIVRHDSHMRKFGVTRLGIGPGSLRWEASRLTAQPPCLPRVFLTRTNKVLEVDKAARVQLCEWYLPNIAPEELQDGYVLFSDEAWFHLSGYVDSQNMRHPSGDNPPVLTEAPLHPQKLGVWCAVSSRRIIPVFFHETVNSSPYIEHIFNVFAEQLTGNGRDNAYFQQDRATAHTACATIVRIESVFQPDRVISRGTNQPMPPCSPDLSVCDSFLWGAVKREQAPAEECVCETSIARAVITRRKPPCGQEINISERDAAA